MSGSSILNNGVINQGSAPAILAGALANRPAQGYEGLIYIANDAGNESISQYISGAWVTLTGGASLPQNLQSVCALGNLYTALNAVISLTTTSGKLNYIGITAPSVRDSGVLSIRNNFALGFYSFLYAENATADREIQLPDNNGNLVLSVENNFADTAGNVILATLPSVGTWAPTFSALSAGLNTVISAEQWNFVRTGTIVTCFGSCAVDTNAGSGVQENFKVDLPINSDFTSGNVCSAGGSAIGDQATRWQGGFIEPDLATSPGLITTYFDVLPLQTIIASFHFSYLIT